MAKDTVLCSSVAAMRAWCITLGLIRSAVSFLASDSGTYAVYNMFVLKSR